MMHLVTIWKDITDLPVDAIVNAANESLLGGGGVDGAIHRAAGPKLLAECRTLGGAKTGEAKITGGYLLPAKFVIHTPGPIYGRNDGQDAELLASCYRESLKRAQENDVKTIAFPCISTGVFGYPKEEAARIAIATVREFLTQNPGCGLEDVIFSTASKEDYELYVRLLK